MARARSFVMVTVFACAVALWAAGCSSLVDHQMASESTVKGKAHFQALSTYSATLGTPIVGYGSNLPLNDSRLQLVFQGTFAREDGRTTLVNTSVDVKKRSGSDFMWDGFGPFSHPFTPRGDEPGKFRGTVGIREITGNGIQLADPDPLPVEFTVKPSLVLRNFTPLTARCENRILRAFGGLPYGISVGSSGFRLSTVTYVVSASEAGYDNVSLTHSPVNGDVDEVVIMMPYIPDELHAFTMITRIVATDDRGQTHEMTFGVGVHRPIEVVLTGDAQVAEIYTPKPVSGCIPGGENNRTVTYSESQSETRSRSLQFSWNEGWLREHAVSRSTTNETSQGYSVTTGRSNTREHSDSTENGWSASNGFNLSSTNGRSGEWSVDQSRMNATSESSSRSDFNQTKFSMSFGGGFMLINTNPSAWYKQESTPIRVAYNQEKDYTNQTSSSNTNTMQGTASMSIGEGATQDVSRGQDWSQSVNGSEVTTDVHAVTYSQSATRNVSMSHSKTNDVSDTKSESMGMTEGQNNAVSSSQAIGNAYTGIVISGMYGVLYRQTIRLVNTASIIAYDQCGNAEIAGKMQGEDYKFSPDLGVATHCPPLPPSNLEPYQCFDSRCTGDST